MLLFSIFLKLTLVNHVKPIKKTNAYRVFGVIPIRETIGIPPISFVLWYCISKRISHKKINLSNLFFENITATFITGFIIHKTFNIKSKLGWMLCITEKPDGTGLAPYSNY